MKNYLKKISFVILCALVASNSIFAMDGLRLVQEDVYQTQRGDLYPLSEIIDASKRNPYVLHGLTLVEEDVYSDNEGTLFTNSAYLKQRASSRARRPRQNANNFDLIPSRAGHYPATRQPQSNSIGAHNNQSAEEAVESMEGKTLIGRAEHVLQNAFGSVGASIRYGYNAVCASDSIANKFLYAVGIVNGIAAMACAVTACTVQKAINGDMHVVAPHIVAQFATGRDYVNALLRTRNGLGLGCAITSALAIAAISLTSDATPAKQQRVAVTTNQTQQPNNNR